MNDRRRYEDFCKDYGEQMAEDIFLSLYGDIKLETIDIWGKHRLDAVNVEFMATIYDDKGNELCEVSCRDGNWAGSEILDYGDIVQPDRYTSIIRLDIDDVVLNGQTKRDQEIIRNFPTWKKQKWFIEMEQKISYDFHFEPTEKIYTYWKGKANSKGLKIVSETIKIEN